MTSEVESNLDVRIGTGEPRGTRLVRPGNLAAISRIGESGYEPRLYSPNNGVWFALRSVKFFGNKGKRYGFVFKREFNHAAGVGFD